MFLLGAATTARADDVAPAAAGKPAQQLTIPKGKLVIDAFIDINLSTGAAFDPVSISPDIWYGLSDDITLGLVHSTAGQFGFVSGPGSSLCFGDNCPGVYDNFGIDGRFRLKGPWTLDAALLVDGLATDAIVAGKLGASARWVSNKLILEVQPSLLIAFSGRDFLSDALLAPITLGYALSPKLQLGVQTGVILPFKNTSDALSIPVSLLTRFKLNPKLSAGLAFSFLSLDEGADARSLTLGVSYAL
ncbi:MAG: hypothetical protein KF773_03885 [Deltaproteobacteria bacterium]|nr:hypothetical protein [Deltaproteobacteria bacterium]MCW5804073.1 hypothetical protein [Deltaproteobacteria bacterium]